MKKQILQIILLAIIAAAGILSVSAQENQPKKLREVKKVKIWVDGVSDFLRTDVRKHKKC
jgi:hypothetical protein